MTFDHRRTAKRAPLVLLLLALLVFGAARPRPARAVGTAVIVVSSIAGYVAFVLAGTWLVYTRNKTSQQPFLPESALPETDSRAQGSLRLGPNCRTADGTMPLLCW